MRYDADGFFWQDKPVEKKGKREPAARVRPPIPDTGWSAPDSFPDLSGAKQLIIDVETYDPNLLTKGPGGARGDGHMVGLSVGTDDGHRWYFPMRHELGGNLDPDMVLSWARDELCRASQPKIGANLMYDLEWFRYEGVTIQGELHDVQFAEPLLDEYAQSYSLETLGQKYLNAGKVSNDLYEWASQAYGGSAGGKQRKNIYRCPVELVGPYAESDVDVPWHVLQKQIPLLKEQGLWDAYRLECDLIYMMLDMRMGGVRVNVDGTEQLKATLQKRIVRDQMAIDKLAGRVVDINASSSVAPLFNDVKVPITAKTGVPSITKPWLEGMAVKGHPAAQLIMDIRKWNKFLTTFVQGYILDSVVGDRIYGQFHQLRSDDSGTISYRMSSSKPNLQNIPARDPELGPLMRSLFIPDDNEQWFKYDYSQVEPRLTLHYSKGDVAKQVRQQFIDDPKADVYEGMMAMMDAPLSRRDTKDMYLGMTYGMGKKNLAKTLGRSMDEAEPVFKAFHDGAPYIAALSESVQKKAASAGELKLLLGHVAHFPMWESKDWKQARKDGVMSMENALKLYGDFEKGIGYMDSYSPAKTEKQAMARITRAWMHKALNRLIQGGAAGIMKKAMLDYYNSAEYAEVGAPMLTVHDELDFSMDQDPAVVLAIKETMENAVTLKLPLKVDVEFGPNWGSVEDY